MGDSVAADLAAVVLAAGAGERLAPLTRLRPKPLCPVGNVALLDGALSRVATLVPPGAVAVNVHHHRAQMEAHLRGHPEVHVSVEPDRARGTAGALGWLQGWLDGRPVLVVNGDSWAPGSLAPLVRDWDGERVRVLVNGPRPFGPGSPVVASLLPWSAVAGLSDEPSGLYEVCWRPAQAAGTLESVSDLGPFVDCGTPARYLHANLLVARAAANGEPGAVMAADAVVADGATVVDSVVGAGAVIEGEVRASVVWPGAKVYAHERLDRAVRADDGVTVLVR
jgi:MurNAc alpha-1-phosphate uridylyltransferase